LEANYIQNVPKEVFQKFLESITECGGILEQLKFSLNCYSDSKFTNNKEIYKDKIKKSLSELKANKGYEIFLILFNYQFINSLGEKVLPEVIELIPVVNPLAKAKCPWDPIPLWLYQKDIEKRFAKNPLGTPNPERITDIDDYKNILFIDPIFNEVIRSFVSQQKNARTREIYEIFANYCILKELKKDFDYRVLKKDGVVAPANEEEINSIREEFKLYFNEYYKKIESQLDENIYKAPTENHDWNELISKANEFHNELISFKNSQLEDLINYDKDEIERLLFEIKNFLIKTESLDWKIYPKVSDISGIDGGSGLIKKIISKGGMKKIGGMYALKVKDWLVENALKEESQFVQPKPESGFEDFPF